MICKENYELLYLKYQDPKDLMYKKLKIVARKRKIKSKA